MEKAFLDTRMRVPGGVLGRNRDLRLGCGEVLPCVRSPADLALWNSVARVTVFCVSVGQESLLLRELAHDSGEIYLEVGVEKDG